eukprot:750994-Hanusia_phi.AAC.2
MAERADREGDELDRYASSKDLVEMSCSGELLPRLKALRVKSELLAVSANSSLPCCKQDGGLPIMVMYGEKNYGRFSSAALLEHNVRTEENYWIRSLNVDDPQGFKIQWVARGGHSMHKDEGVNLCLGKRISQESLQEGSEVDRCGRKVGCCGRKVGCCGEKVDRCGRKDGCCGRKAAGALYLSQAAEESEASAWRTWKATRQESRSQGWGGTLILKGCDEPAAVSKYQGGVVGRGWGSTCGKYTPIRYGN